MTSKEALNKLYEFALSSESMEIIIKDFKDIILKDLEILNQYKAANEELGLEYPVFLKAAKYGFYKKNDNGTIEFVEGGDLYLAKFLELKKFVMLGTHEDVYFSSYGSKWALTREELENDK